MTKRAVAVLALVVAAFAPGCTGSEEPTEAVESDATAIAAGMHVLGDAWDGDKASDVVVRGTTAYVGLGRRGLAVVDAKTMTTKKRILRDGEDKLLPADHVQLVGTSLVASGLRDDSPLEYGAGADYNFVISVLNPTTGAVKKQVLVNVMKALSKPSATFFQIPTVAATLEDGEVWLMVSHERLSKVVHFTLPSAARTELDLTDLSSDDAPAVEYGKSVAVRDGAAYVPEPEGRDDGYVRRIDLATGTSTTLGTKLGYPVGVAFTAGAMLVADHSGNLFAVDPDSGETLSQIEVPDWVTGVSVTGGNVFVSTWSGIFVAKNEWR